MPISLTTGATTPITVPADSRLILRGQGVYRIGGLGTSQRPTVDEQLEPAGSIVGPFPDSCVVTVIPTAATVYDVMGPGAVPGFDGGVANGVAASLQSSLPTDGSQFAVSEAIAYVQRTTTGTAFTGACEYAGFEVVSGSGTITIYDNTSAAGTVIVPATAVSVGKQERTWKLALGLGLHIVISGTLTINVFVG